MTGQDALSRSQASAEAEAGAINSPVKECLGWIKVAAVYDDPWCTPVTDRQVCIKVDGEVVADGPRTKSLSVFGMEDGQPHDAVRTELGVYSQNGVKPGSAVISLVPEGPDDSKEIEKQILDSLLVFESSMREALLPWLTEWAQSGWLSIPDARRHGQIRGIASWWEGEMDFWASLDKAAGHAWEGMKSGAASAAQWYKNLPLDEKLFPDRIVRRKVAEWAKDLWDGADKLWERRDQLMKLLKAFSEGTAAAIEEALSVLIDLPGEWGALIQALVEHSVDWVQNMIEVARETDVFTRVTNTIMRVMMMMTPNFWAEGLGVLEGYIVPEVLITVVLIIIGALCAAAGASVLATRIAGVLTKFRAAIAAVGRVGRVIARLFDKVEEFAKLIGKLSKALRRKISETYQGVTNSINRLVRKAFLPKWPKFKPRVAKSGAKTGINDTVLDGKWYSVNSEHAWDKAHKSGTKPSQIGVGKNDLESAIVHDLHTYTEQGGVVPPPGGKNFDRTIIIGNKSVGYRSSALATGETRILTYWINP